MESTVEDLAFKTRALAQAHPLSENAQRYVNFVVGDQRTSQPLPEIGIWAGSALIEGYCLRRVEESEYPKLSAEAALSGALRDVGLKDGSIMDRLELFANQLAAQIRTGSADYLLCIDPYRTEEVLDHLIFAQVQRRLDHWRDTIDDAAWKELEEYLTWWTVKGYALRCAEVGMGSTVLVTSEPEAEANGTGTAGFLGLGSE